jgi:RNA polymerase sigma-70 factor (ECF subfamily)
MDEIVEKIYANQIIINSICFSFCSEKAEREDLFQEIIYRVLKSYHQFRENSSFSTWLYRIALNTAITYRKKKRPLLFDSKPELIANENITEDKDLEEDIQLLYKSIASLNKIDRAIILLYLDEHSYQEIADVTGFTEKNISVKIHRIKKKLHEIYIQLSD